VAWAGASTVGVGRARSGGEALFVKTILAYTEQHFQKYIRSYSYMLTRHIMVLEQCKVPIGNGTINTIMQRFLPTMQQQAPQALLGNLDGDYTDATS
jgi:hypothetical protein